MKMSCIVSVFNICVCNILLEYCYTTILIAKKKIYEKWVGVLIVSVLYILLYYTIFPK